jgi:hypothetical protein
MQFIHAVPLFLALKKGLGHSQSLLDPDSINVAGMVKKPLRTENAVD